jgi:hypothetical protein
VAAAPSGGRKKAKSKGPTPAELEAEIHLVESRMSELSSLLSTEDVARDKGRLFELSEQYQEFEDRLGSLYERWEAALADEGA